MPVFQGSDVELNRRRIRLYTDLVDVWSVLRASGQEDTYVLTAQRIPAKYTFTPNVDDLTSGGRIKRFSLLITDILHLPVDVPVTNGSWIVNVTPGNRNEHAIHKVLGDAQYLPGAGRRDLNLQILEIMQDEMPPLELLEAYGLGG